jgi:hypothetical protein
MFAPRKRITPYVNPGGKATPKLDSRPSVKNNRQLTAIKDIWKVQELRDFFHIAQLPGFVQLDRCTRIVDVPLFIETHLEIVDHHNGNETYEGYLIRLQKLMVLIEANLIKHQIPSNDPATKEAWY